LNTDLHFKCAAELCTHQALVTKNSIQGSYVCMRDGIGGRLVLLQDRIFSLPCLKNTANRNLKRNDNLQLVQLPLAALVSCSLCTTQYTHCILL